MGVTIRCANEFNLVSDGNRMVLQFGDQTFMFDDFFIVNAAFGCETHGPLRLSLELVGSSINSGDNSELDYKFAMDMTMRELLTAIRKKLTKRKEELS